MTRSLNFPPLLICALRSRMLTAGVLLFALHAAAYGGTITFSTDPLAGTVVRNAPGRQLVGGELFVAFNTATDVFAFDPVVFGGTTRIDFANGPINAIAGGIDVAVLQTLDDDANPLTPFGAFNAADLLAGRITQHGPGVFVYFNQDLALPVLVYSDDLASNQADLKVLARMINLNGQLGINALPRFSTANFDITDPPSAVPEPSSLVISGAGVALVAIGAFRRLRRPRYKLSMR